MHGKQWSYPCIPMICMHVYNYIHNHTHIHTICWNMFPKRLVPLGWFCRCRAGDAPNSLLHLGVASGAVGLPETMAATNHQQLVSYNLLCAVYRIHWSSLVYSWNSLLLFWNSLLIMFQALFSWRTHFSNCSIALHIHLTSPAFTIGGRGLHLEPPPLLPGSSNWSLATQPSQNICK